MHKLIAPTLVAFSLLLCSGAAKPAPQPDSEAVEAAHRYGMDYAAMFFAAWDHKKALPPFLALCATETLDAAASDQFCTDLAKLMTKYGDKTFAEAMSAFSEETKKNLREDLEYGSPRYHQTHPYTSSRATLATTYTVIKGDTLEKIARRTHPDDVKYTLQQIIALNDLKSPNAIREGQILKLP